MGYEEINSSWNITSKMIPFIEEIIERIDNYNESQPTNIQLDIADIGDWKNIAVFEELLKLKIELQNVGDWTTEAVGSLFIKNLKGFQKKCLDITKPLMDFNDLFMLPEQNLSLPDIALLYTANDFRVIDTNDHYENSHQLNHSLRDCLEHIRTNSFDEVTHVEVFTHKELSNADAKYMKPSPCFNLTKFPKCNQYCRSHRHFFEKVKNSEFLTIMKYAMPQRKLR